METESTASKTGSPPRSLDRKVTAASPSACISCRSMHLKCDRLPLCARCSAQGIKCVYLKSRRGYRGPDKNGKQSSSVDGSQKPGELDLLGTNFSQGETRSKISSSVSFQQESNDWEPTTPSSRTNGQTCRQRCIAAFFYYLYDSHPFLPPRDEFLQFLERNSVGHLETAICVVGARYVPGVSPTSFATDFDTILASSSPPKDASMVQAMLLFALALDGYNDQKRAIQILIKAQSLALELGMNEQEYALYIVSVVAAGFHGRRTFHSTNTMFNLPLPFTENEFAAGCIPAFHTIEEFDDISFSDEKIEWSSYTYRIAAVMNLERILQSNVLTSPDNSIIDRQDAYLVNWGLHLPESKMSYFDQFGTFDEMIFQAHMITNLSSILLHRNFSGLEGLAAQTTRSCTEQTQAPPGPSTDIIHALKTAQAASNISKLVALPVPLVRHTHFFICALALSSITHLSLWSTLPVMAPDEDLEKQILMNLGGLRAVAGAWPAARVGYSQVQKVAQKIYLNRKDALGDAFWRHFIDKEIVKGRIGSEATINA
ncbi:hypothetical protein BKA65DRAFT_527610 [Rhexocercosporidium sp. MPI-PUGE-AT-0058]|nr:hypothetical protein BKA65DRAFT_527610 [Rhexocercosporidium sp. MPI-PUGE-AT-0058]